MGTITYLTPIVDEHDCSPVKTLILLMLSYDYYRLLCASHAEQEVSVNALVTPSSIVSSAYLYPIHIQRIIRMVLWAI